VVSTLGFVYLVLKNAQKAVLWDGTVATLRTANVDWVGKTKKRPLLCDKRKAKFAVRYAGVRTDVTCAFHFVVSLLQAGLLKYCLMLLCRLLTVLHLAL
jgi:hypothetical protein